MRQRRGDGRVHAAAEPAEQAPAADLRADPLDRLRDEIPGRPVTPAAADVPHEVRQQVRSLRRVDHLRVELDPEPPPVRIAHRRDVDPVRPRRRRECRRQRVDMVSVRHPDVHRVRQAGEDGAFAAVREAGRAELALGRRRDAAAEPMRHLLHPVADAQQRQLAVQRPLRRTRRVRVVDGCGAAREDHAFGIEPGRVRARERRRRELAVDVQFADASRDQHRRLRAHVEDDDRLAGFGGHQRCSVRSLLT